MGRSFYGFLMKEHAARAGNLSTTRASAHQNAWQGSNTLHDLAKECFNLRWKYKMSIYRRCLRTLMCGHLGRLSIFKL